MSAWRWPLAFWLFHDRFGCLFLQEAALARFFKGVGCPPVVRAGVEGWNIIKRIFYCQHFAGVLLKSLKLAQVHFICSNIIIHRCGYRIILHLL